MIDAITTSRHGPQTDPISRQRRFPDPANRILRRHRAPRPPPDLPPVPAPSLGPRLDPKSRPQVLTPSLDPSPGRPGDRPHAAASSRSDRRTPKHPSIARCHPVRRPQAGPRLPTAAAIVGRWHPPATSATAGRPGTRRPPRLLWTGKAPTGRLGHRGPARHPPATSAIVDRPGIRRSPRLPRTGPAPAGRLGHRRPARHRRPPQLTWATSATAGRRESLGTHRPPRPPRGGSGRDRCHAGKRHKPRSPPVLALRPRHQGQPSSANGASQLGTTPRNAHRPHRDA